MKNRENLIDLSEQELEEKFRHYKEELFNLRFQVVTGQLANPARISIVKKQIARVRTQISKMQKDRIRAELKEEYTQLLKSKAIDPMQVPLKERLALLKTQLSHKAQRVKREIRAEVDSKVTELLKNIRHSISEKLKSRKVTGKEEEKLRATSQRLREPGYRMRKKFLDKMAGMGFNEASQIKSLKETKQAKLDELERIRTLQRELISGRLPF